MFDNRMVSTKQNQPVPIHRKRLLGLDFLDERVLPSAVPASAHPDSNADSQVDATKYSRVIPQSPDLEPLKISMDLPSAQVVPLSKASTAINLPRGTMPAGGWPVVFLFNGDAMGAVGGGAQAANLSNTLLKNGVATAVVSYPNLVSVDTFEKSIVAVLQNAASGHLADSGKINPHQFGVAGFSAGGFVSTFLLAKYAHGYGYDLRGGISYYGFADLNTWFAYHRSEAKGILPTDPLLRGGNDPNSVCYTPRGPAICKQHSSELISAVGAHIAGPSVDKLQSFSTTNVINQLVSSGKGAEVAPIYGVFGSKDPNIIPAINQRQIQALWSQAGSEYHYSIYAGTHGAEWTVAPDSMNWLVAKLSSNDSSSISGDINTVRNVK